MNSHTWNDQRFTSMENSRTKLLKYLHCFQNFGQFKILKFYVQSLASNAQSPQSSFQFPESGAQRPESNNQSPSSRAQKFRYAAHKSSHQQISKKSN